MGTVLDLRLAWDINLIMKSKISWGSLDKVPEKSKGVKPNTFHLSKLGFTLPKFVHDPGRQVTNVVKNILRVSTGNDGQGGIFPDKHVRRQQMVH